MLHERIRDENEIAGNPTAECNRDRGGKMCARAESFLAPDQRTDKRALQEEREHPFHRQRLTDDATSVFGKVRPIRSENFRPKSDGLVVFIIAGAERAPFPVNDEPRQSHRELWKQVVINDREPELQPVPK